MTVVELKALAKKKKVSLPAGAKKVELIAALTIAPTRKRLSAKQVNFISKSVAKKKTKPRKGARGKKPVAAQKASTEKLPKRVSPVCEWKVPPQAEEPLMVQEQVSEAKYYTGPARTLPTASYGDLPHGYGEEKITLMTRDPFVAYAYWEVAPARIERERAWLGLDAKLCVRIYNITGIPFDGRNAIGYYDQEITEHIGSWYFDFGRPSHSFCADLGLITPKGKFLTLVRLNCITMPREGVSDATDDKWMLPDEEFMMLYGIPSGLSSPQIQEKMKRRRTQEITSPGMFAQLRAKRK